MDDLGTSFFAQVFHNWIINVDYKPHNVYYCYAQPLQFWLNEPLVALSDSSIWHQLLDKLIPCVRCTQELYNEGARNIAIGGLPPLGCLPSQITLHGDGINCIASFNAVAASYNAALNQMTQNLKPSLPGSRLMYMDSLQYPLHVLQNPLAYGKAAPTYPIMF